MKTHRFTYKTVALLALPLIAACSGGEGGPAAGLAQMDTAVTTQAVSQPKTATQPLTDFSVWAQRLMADAISPFPVASADLSEVWTGANGKLADVIVRTPRTAGKAPVAITAPAAGEDATPVVEAALAKLKAQGGGVLQVGAGEYHFKSLNKLGAPGLAHIVLNNLSDVDIQGAGATFLFEAKSDGILFTDCQRVRIKAVSMRDVRVLGGTGRMHASATGMTLQLDAPLPEGTTINWVQPMNEGSHTWTYTRSRAIINANAAQPVLVGDRTYQSPLFSNLADNQFVSVKYTYYGSRAVYIRDSDTGTNDDVILDGIRIGTTGGMGVLVKSRGRGVGIVNSTITADPGQTFSTNYDGIHVIASGGDILIRNNAISHTGDDQINVRSIIHKVTNLSTDGATLTNEARLIRSGDEVAFFDANGDYVGRRFVSAVLTNSSADTRSFAFTTGGPIDKAAYARVMQFTSKRLAIVGNTMTDSAGRGILLQVPNALIKNNTIARVPSTTIRLFSSFQEWWEGAGAVNVRIAQNTIDQGAVEGGRSYPFGIITAAAEVQSNKLAANYQHGPMVIENNRFTAPKAPCIMIYNAKGVTDQGNVCGG